MHKWVNTNYDRNSNLLKNCILGNSNSQSQLANISIDVVMPPLNKKREKTMNVHFITPKLKGKKEYPSIKCNDILEQTQEKVVLDNSFVKCRRSVVPSLVLKELSWKITFDEKVVEERSPQSVPFSQYNVDKMYKTKIFNDRKEKKNLQRRETSRKTPLNLESPKKVNSETWLGMRASSETFLLGRNDSPKALKPKSPKRISKQLASISKNIVEEPDHGPDFSSMPVGHIWEEHVLSRLSEATADLILRDENSAHMERYAGSRHVMKISDFSINENLKEEKTSQDETESVSKVDSVDNYFEDIPIKHKKSNEEKNVQDAFPYSPTKWLECEHRRNSINKIGRVTRGMQKWTKYPTYKEGKQLVLHQVSDIELCDKPPASLPVFTKKKHGYTLIPVVNEWRDKWILDRQYVESSFTGLISGMDDISENIRYAAVSAIGLVITEQEISADEEEILMNKAEELLDDNSFNVSLAGAVTLFCMKKATTKATEMLMKTVQEGHLSERWVAVQCLVEYLYHDNCIIRELISNIISDDVHKREKSVCMLKKLSHLSMSIQYMVAEKLNSGSWRDRVVACQVLPNLDSTLSKDIANKLSYLIWNDWSVDVRKAAAEALGKTGNGKLVHNILRERLQGNNRNKQISALKKIASLGIMTAHLLSPLILCLDSHDDEVCLQTIKICMKMKLNDENILNALVKLLTSDRACKVRRYTLRALGYIGHNSHLIRDNLLWTLHFNKEPILRREACSTMVKLGFKDEEIINVLQDIVFIDKDASVRRQVAIALYSMGLEAVGNINLIETIQENVKQLCSKDKVIAQVVDGRFDKLLHESSTVENAYLDSSDDSDVDDSSTNSDDNDDHD